MTALAAARILVVDDDPGLRTLLEAYLGDSGFVVETAMDGPAMWQALEPGMPDAIVLDLMMPGEDGLSLARRLRSRSNVPILMLSARGEEIDRVVGLEIGADDSWPSPSVHASCWPACVRCCGAARDRPSLSLNRRCPASGRTGWMRPATGLLATASR